MHLSENAIRLKEELIRDSIADAAPATPGVELILLPFFQSLEGIPDKKRLSDDIKEFINRTDHSSTIAILSSPIFAADFCANLNGEAQLKLWVAVKLDRQIPYRDYLPSSHAALLVFTRHRGSLTHTKTRIGYTYCPFCERTTKDYGGKKHLYHEFGTLMSDVWRDITVDFEKYPRLLVDRLRDLFGLPGYDSINVYDQRKSYAPKSPVRTFAQFRQTENVFCEQSLLINGDCIQELKRIPDNSIDFCFADPPYNLNKKYESWNDEIDIREYFEWCDTWLGELSRVLKPGRTLAVLNIPQWSVRHFKHLVNILDYQDWIVWEGLGMPVRMIMPAHYSILCFSKGKPRRLPGMIRQSSSLLEKRAIQTLSEGFCLRQDCINKRKRAGIRDTQNVSNLWWDIHRLKHNSKRVDHPTQLPPMFMYRLLSLFTNEGELVLDPFNGSGTTTLAAEQLNRKYIGIELSQYYHELASKRHQELRVGIDPFGKNNGETPKAKNSPVARLKKQKYHVSKKTLQLEIKKIASELGHIPSKQEVEKLSHYPMDYYEKYFINWAEVTAAARTTGMTEFKKGKVDKDEDQKQLRLFKQSRGKYTKDKRKSYQIVKNAARSKLRHGHLGKKGSS